MATAQEDNGGGSHETKVVLVDTNTDTDGAASCLIPKTPEPPYYSVIFTSIKKASADGAGYSETAVEMEHLAKTMPGFLGIESARNTADDGDGLGITISYWRSLDDIKRWKAHTSHISAQQQGKTKWYQHYKVRIAKVEREYGFEALK